MPEQESERVIAATNAAEQRAIDIQNLRFYAEMFREHEWSTVVFHWSVFEHTLRDIAQRLERLPPPQEPETIRIPRQPGRDLTLARDRLGNTILLCGNRDGGAPDLLTEGRVLLDARLASELAMKFAQISRRLKQGRRTHATTQS